MSVISDDQHTENMPFFHQNKWKKVGLSGLAATCGLGTKDEEMVLIAISLGKTPIVHVAFLSHK